MNTIIKRLNITFYRYAYLIIFTLPFNIYVIGDKLDVIVQWVFFRGQLEVDGIFTLVPITTSLCNGLLSLSDRNTTYECLLFLGSLCFVISYILLFYRTTEPVKKAGLLTVFGAGLITSAYVLPLGPTGISIPVGMPFILVLGFLMYWYHPDNPDVHSNIKRDTKSGNLTGTGNISSVSTPIKTNSFVCHGIRLDYYISLIVLNFVTNFIFLPYYGFTGDDWSQFFHAFSGIGVTNLLFESHRPIFYIILKILPVVFGDTPTGYFLLNFLITSILLLLVFLVAKSLLGKIQVVSESYSFLIALLFCILFNKGELYAFGSITPNNIAFALFLVSFFLYMNADRKPTWFYLSIISFTIALFIYELGIFLPLVYCIYSFFFEKSYKKPLAFVLPVLMYCGVRFTNWIGYGNVVNAGNGITPVNFLASFGGILPNIEINLVILMNSFFNDIVNGIAGLQTLPFFLIISFVFLDIVIALILSWLLNKNFREEPEKTEFKGFPLVVLGCAGIVLSFVLISLNGYLAERYLVFIDFFGCLIVVLIAIKCTRKKTIVYGLFFIVVFCLIMNQGLYSNWVVSGNIQHNFNEAVIRNSGNISGSGVVYVNITDLQVVNGNYLNAVGLHSWSIVAMMQNSGVDASNITLIYNVEDENWKPYEPIGNRSFFELNRSNVDVAEIYFR